MFSPSLFRPDTHVREMTAVVVDPDHHRFGQIARLEAHDWKEGGTYFVRFPDGETTDLDDGLDPDDWRLPQARCHRTREDGHRILELHLELPNIRTRLKTLYETARKEHASLQPVRAVREEVIRVLNETAGFATVGSPM
ncbi:MAG: hypothetical protein A3A43_02025 [Candidatus Liptonbacteria bacterium RIFCSPLOWO2_01_FULL_56_20]|uniref:Uncharacterized protein n=1 Tax=Candidatus Liptonbacteria bacterium RIFCSPLOWO2_01_FULL_56_20 TaxID=1798652 RepID=A0A1G2CGY0_9BACT|nr:MAG: hypothetical protein UY96_C0019G0013 [Parcubacteria group bacterium GW2011_GWB1_56_8]OGY97515.1 MAG: hypothetical protein A2681_00835 [Candidatus Liptonbacteria bacterium RIFCSPHIGHO2_01_FULL_56_18b]OGZ00664.1 MAG: hypothetical protein A3A43_02025 [Candidatus Liptonbacteria bacterium RIFCSPLOWO2_01_FULL_56_20]